MKIKILALVFFSVSLFGMERPYSDTSLLAKKVQAKKIEIEAIQLQLRYSYEKLCRIRAARKMAYAKDKLRLLALEEEKRERKYKLIEKELKRSIINYKEMKEALRKMLFRDQYPKIYGAIPLTYHAIAVRSLSVLDKKILIEANQSIGAASELVWKAITHNIHFDVEKIWDGKAGYIFFKPKEATGKLTNVSYDEIPPLRARAHKAKDKEAQERLEKIAGQYKIHLMPHRNYLGDVVLKLIGALKCTSLGPLIDSFKVKYKQETLETVVVGKLAQKERMPRIVIYVAEGKAQAQHALNKIIAIFKNDVEKGIDIAPRWNQKVNKLIFFAQGDGDCKRIAQFEKYFEQPAMIYYSPLLTGAFHNYHLTF
jgi:hypothetical protein